MSHEQTAPRRHSVDYRGIARGWERLRLWYNLVVGAAGVVGISPYLEIALAPLSLAYMLLFALFANIAYFAGHAIEMYLAWLGFERTRLRAVLFVSGCVLMALVTFAIGRYAGAGYYREFLLLHGR